MPLLLQSYALSRFIVDMFAENHLAAIDWLLCTSFARLLGFDWSLATLTRNVKPVHAKCFRRGVTCLPIPLVFCCSLIWLWFHDAQHPRTTYNFRWTLIVHHMSFPIGNYSTTHLIKTWHPADAPTMNGGVQRAAIALTSIANYSRASCGRGVGYATNKHHISSLARAILIGHSSILPGGNYRYQRCPRRR